MLMSCKEKEAPRAQPDVSEITIDTTLIRWEQEMFSIPKGKVAEGLQDMWDRHPEIYPFFINVVLNLYDTTNGVQPYALFMEEFIHDKNMRSLYDTVQILYGDFGPYRKQFEQAFRNYSYYFPELPKPNLLTFISQFGPKTFYWGNTLGLGLDMYLGEDYTYYQSFDFPNYFIKRLEPQYLVTDGIYTLSQDMIEDPYLKRGNKLIDIMVYYGKIYYIASHLLPDMPMHRFFYYTEENWQWCKDNEKEIWSFFIEGEWLYETQFAKYRKFTDDAPTTLGMPQGAPDRVGRFTGYRIVQEYMKKFPETTLAELAAMRDGQEMLSKSRYKPGI